MSKRIISIFLALILVFSLIPSVVFAGDNNTDFDDSTSGRLSNNSEVFYTTRSYGYRFSIYFSEDEQSYKQVGSTVDVQVKGDKSWFNSINAYSLMNVFKRMNNIESGVVQDIALNADGSLAEYPYNMRNDGHIHFIDRGKYANETNTYYAPDNIETQFLVGNQFNEYFDLYKNNKVDGAYNIFFSGVPEADVLQADPNKIDYTNAAWVMNLCYGDAGRPSYYSSNLTERIEQMSYDFRYGIYHRDGKKVVGTYKLYIEPLLFIKYYSFNMALSYRDILAFAPQWDNFGYPGDVGLDYFFSGGTIAMAQRMYLAHEEPTIHMIGKVSSTVYDPDKTQHSKYAVLGGEMFNTFGVGVITGGQENKKNTPDLIKTYVEIESVDATGKITFKKAAKTTIQKAEFQLDDAGNITQIPIIDYIDNQDGFVGLLNDIVTVDQDLEIKENSEWVNTNLPTNVGVVLKSDANDVAGYMTGLVTDTDFFVNSVRKEARFTSFNVLRSLGKAQDSLTTFSVGGYENHIYAFVNHNGYLDLVKVANATEYTEEGQIKLGVLAEGTIIKDSEIDKKTPANNIILRYVIKPNPSQINVIEIYDENTNETTYISGGIQNLMIEGTTATVQDPDVSGLNNVGTPELISWVTNSEYPTKDISNGVLPPKSVSTKSEAENGLEGSARTIENYPQEPIIHNLYVKWRITIPKVEKEHGKYFVPEWRLSRYFGTDMIDNGSAIMSLPITYGCCGLARLSPTGNYNYTTKNPNGEITQANHSNMKLQSWIHSETVSTGARASISVNNPTAVITLDGVFNAIKSTDTSNLKVITWQDKGSITGLQSYDIGSATKGTTFNQAEYNKEATLKFNLWNLDTYVNTWPYPVYFLFGHYHSWSGYKTISPSGASYTPYSLGVNVEYARFNTKDTGAKSNTYASKITSTNGKTTVAYQLDNALNVYPEIAMLFDNDSNSASIKWAVGEKARAINPVVYHTLQYKAWVIPTVFGSSVATDSRATAKARSLGYADRQVIYKGSATSNTFMVQRGDGDARSAILTVKTFALDVNTNKNGVNIKHEWGLDSYNTLNIHNTFRSKWAFDKANAYEWLEIGETPDYKGDNKVNSVPYKTMTYNGKEVTEFTHELIVRGGKVVGVKLQNRSNSTYSTVKIEDLEKTDAALYEALVNMKLIGSDTVLNNFQHQVGANLTEEKYKTMVADAKNTIDGFKTDNIAVGKGWYSEDTTALVIKEYVTNYEVPATSFSDKISLSVNGLNTPIDKADFFSVMKLGHVSLKYVAKAQDLKSIKSDLTPTEVYFQHDSRTGDDFGGKTVEYLVPNVSITDTTRIS